MKYLWAHGACDGPGFLPRFDRYAAKIIGALSHWGIVAALSVGIIAFAAASAQAAVIDILCLEGEAGCTNFSEMSGDGVIFSANAHPSTPSTGTGVFAPFVRTQTSGKGGDQSGYNTDASEPGINFDTKAGLWTHSLQMGQFTIVTLNSIDYIELFLDANEKGRADSSNNLITINEMQIFIGSDPNLANPEAVSGADFGYSGIPFDDPSVGPDTLLGVGPRWHMDNALNGGNLNVNLQASICDTPGQCGSGFGDLSVLIPLSLLGDFALTDYFVLYTEYSDVTQSGDEADAGFEEWAWRGQEFEPPAVIPLPAAMPLFLTALMGLGGLTYRRRRAAAAA